MNDFLKYSVKFTSWQPEISIQVPPYSLEYWKFCIHWLILNLTYFCSSLRRTYYWVACIQLELFWQLLRFLSIPYHENFSSTQGILIVICSKHWKCFQNSCIYPCTISIISKMIFQIYLILSSKITTQSPSTYASFPINMPTFIS